MVPLVGCVPLQPPDAVQVSAFFALHCKVAGVPMATVLFMAASVTTGFEAALSGPVISPTWVLDDCPHAVSTEIAAEAIAKRKRLFFPMNFPARAAFELISEPNWALRPTNLISCFSPSRCAR
jgi:hypothetical protein